MRVLFLVHSLRRGGAEKVLLEIAKGFQNKGDDVAIVSWLDIDEYPDQQYQGVSRDSLITSSQYRWIRSIPSSSRILKEKIRLFEPDIIQIHTPNVTLLATFCGISVPTIHVLHGYGNIISDGSIRSFLMRVCFRVSAIALRLSFITVSESMVSVASDYYGLKSEVFKTVANGIDQDLFAYSSPPNNSDPVIIMVGTLCKLKGQMLGVAAFKKLINHVPTARLVIVGDGEDRVVLEGLVNRHELSDRISILGNREDIPELLSSADLFWHLSESEAMPLSVLEAMSSGLSVVGFDVRGTRDAVCHGETGYLVPYGDVDGVVKATTNLLKDPDKLKSLSIKCRNRVEQNFSREVMLQKHHAICSSLVRN
jgi:glycosyltransferase involved in cell wall biosynthesis